MSAAAVRKEAPVGDARSAAPKGHTGYAVYDPGGQKIGTAERVFVNPDGERAYIRVRTGYFGTRVVLIPVHFVEADETRKASSLRRRLLHPDQARRNAISRYNLGGRSPP
jgi:hypothetical protein